MENYYTVTLNKHATPASTESLASHAQRPGTAPPSPPDVWGDRLFLIKFQIGLGSAVPPYMMMYDRKRSFQVFTVPQDGAAPFAELLADMRGPRGGYGGIKMYRWARRTGDWEFSVCVDREPQTDTKW